MKRLVWSELSEAGRQAALERPVSSQSEELSTKVAEILKSVRSGGDQILLDLTARFDGVRLQNLRVSEEEIRVSVEQVAPEILQDLKDAIARIEAFHLAQLPRNLAVETAPGVLCERRAVPISRVGLYIPGGTAPLPSTVMMLGVPSRIAGCPLRVLVTPPRKDGSIDRHILAAATLLGIDQIYKVGGAQAIAALAYGTESIPKVDKIFGPGNSWVTEAKVQAAQDPRGAALDLPAGPSEVMVLADAAADAEFVAADLLSQAEHGPDSQVILVSDSLDLIDAVTRAVETQLAKLPRRAIAAQALAASCSILARDLDEAFAISNRYAPEHLILQIKNARARTELVRNAGSVFLGSYTPESAGDYSSGTNHVLPTYGFARAYSGVSTESFFKTISFQELTLEGLQTIGPGIERLAAVEGLQAHKNAVALRLQSVRSEPQAVRKTLHNGPASLARPSVRALKPYRSARSITSAGRVFLDANESPEPGLPDLTNINRYPQPQPPNLLARLAQIYQVDKEQLLIGRGSDEAIDLLIRAFCESGEDQILIAPPTYGVYEISAAIQGAGVVRVPLRKARDWTLDEEGIVAAVLEAKNRIKLVFLCSPNNPTGTAFDPKILTRITERIGGKALVITDEAYAEWSRRESMLSQLSRFPNLLILRTLSKAWAVAGARCGVAIGNPEALSVLQRIRAPYPLSAPQISTIEAAISLESEARLVERVSRIRGERERLREALTDLRQIVRIADSEANFLLVEFANREAMLAAVREKGIVLRDRHSDWNLTNCVRITVGTAAENDELLAVLRGLE